MSVGLFSSTHSGLVSGPSVGQTLLQPGSLAIGRYRPMSLVARSVFAGPRGCRGRIYSLVGDLVLVSTGPRVLHTQAFRQWRAVCQTLSYTFTLSALRQSVLESLLVPSVDKVGVVAQTRLIARRQDDGVTRVPWLVCSWIVIGLHEDGGILKDKSAHTKSTDC